VLFLPSMWLAARYFFPTYVAAIGALFLIGRVWYFFVYVGDPQKRALSAALCFLPIFVFWIIAAIGIVKSLLAG
jgi:glutathione S-transferase